MNNPNIKELTLLDYLAGKFIARGDTCLDAYANAEQALKCRQRAFERIRSTQPVCKTGQYSTSDDDLAIHG